MRDSQAQRNAQTSCGPIMRGAVPIRINSNEASKPFEYFFDVNVESGSRLLHPRTPPTPNHSGLPSRTSWEPLPHRSLLTEAAFERGSLSNARLRQIGAALGLHCLFPQRRRDAVGQGRHRVSRLFEPARWYRSPSVTFSDQLGLARIQWSVAHSRSLPKALGGRQTDMFADETRTGSRSSRCPRQKRLARR